MTHPNRRGAGARASDGCAHCDATTTPGPGYPIDRHRDDCPLFDTSRALRESDAAWLAANPDAAEMIRPLHASEDADLAQFGPPPTDRRERRRWTVAVALEARDGLVHLCRWFRYDGHRVAGVMDTVQAGASR